MPRGRERPNTYLPLPDGENGERTVELRMTDTAVATIDADMEAEFRKHHWYVHHNNGVDYVRSKHGYAYVLVVGPRPEHLVMRHLNGDRFDLRRANLSFMTFNELRAERRVTTNTGERCITKRDGKFIVDMKFRGVRCSHTFDTLVGARTWRDARIVELNNSFRL